MYYLVVTPFFPRPNSYIGGYVYDQVRAIRDISGLDVVVYVPGGGKNYVYEGIEVHPFHIKQTPSYFFNGIHNKFNGQSFIKRVLSDGINPENIYAVHCHVSYFGACGLALKKLNPEILTILQHHDLDPFTIRNGKFAGNLLNLYVRAHINKRLFEKIDLHISISRQTEKHLLNFPFATDASSYPDYLSKERKARLLGFKKPKINKSIVLNNGVDTKKFYKTNSPKDNDKFIIGINGNYIPLKNHNVLLRAVKTLVDKGYDDIIIRTIGRNPQNGFEQFQHDVKSLGLEKHVEYFYALPHERMREFYNGLDLFVLPSVFEGFGCVFLEAYACGVPFMSCTGQGISDVLTPDQQADWLAKPNDPHDLAMHIEDFIIHSNPQELLSDFTIDKLIGNFINSLNSMRTIK